MRPWWEKAALGLCLFGALAYVPYDLFGTPVAEAEEVWFGVTLRGRAAKLGELAHWVVWAVGAWGLWHRRTWVPVAAGTYLAQVAIAHVVWSELDPRGRGLGVGLLQGLVFGALALGWFRARRAFARAAPAG